MRLVSKMINLSNERSKKILAILLEKREPVVTSELAEKFAVSSRTIRNDLSSMQEWLTDNGANLIKKPGVGIWIKTTNEKRNQLKHKLLKLSECDQQLFSVEREKFILKRLLQNESYTIKSLADELYVSRTTIYKSLEQVEKWLAKYDLSLERKRHYGIRLCGQEKDWRKAVADLLVDLKDNEELKKILYYTDDNFKNSRIDSQTYKELRSLFGDIDFRQIEEILSIAEREKNFLFTDDAFVGLVIHIAISIERLRQNKDIEMKAEQLDSLRKEKEFIIAKFIVEKVNEKFGIKVPDAEIGYISLHILGAKVQQNIATKNIKEVIKNTDSKVISIARSIIDITEDVLNVELKKDEQLFLGLILHLRPAINRLQYGLSLRNPLLDNIKANYPAIFGAAWASSIVFQKQLNLTVTEEEIGYLALHIGAALERIKARVKAVIVCSSGVGTSQLVASRLEKRLANLEIIAVVSAHEIVNMNLNTVDIILTTIPLNNSIRPVLRISYLVTDNDLEQIENKIGQIITKKKKTNLEINLPSIEESSLFNDNLIFIDLKLKSKQEIIRFLTEKVIAAGYARSKFSRLVLAREELTSTALKNGVAIPHGGEEYIDKSVAVIATLEQPILWGNDLVDVVFLLALNNQIEAKEFFKYFQIILDDEDLLTRIRKATTRLEMEQILSFSLGIKLNN